VTSLKIQNGGSPHLKNPILQLWKEAANTMLFLLLKMFTLQIQFSVRRKHVFTFWSVKNYSGGNFKKNFFLKSSVCTHLFNPGRNPVSFNIFFVKHEQE
jgi:hypothetical protein